MRYKHNQNCFPVPPQLISHTCPLFVAGNRPRQDVNAWAVHVSSHAGWENPLHLKAPSWTQANKTLTRPQHLLLLCVCVCVCVCMFVCVCVCMCVCVCVCVCVQSAGVGVDCHFTAEEPRVPWRQRFHSLPTVCRGCSGVLLLSSAWRFYDSICSPLGGGGACNRVNFDIPAARRSEERALKRIQVISCYCVCLRLFVSLCVCVCVCAYASLLLLLLSLSRTAPSLLLLPLSRSWRSRKSKPLQKLRPTRSASLLHARTLALRCVHIVALPLQGSNQPVLSLTHTLTHTHTHTLSLYLSISLSTSPFIPSFLPFLTPNLLLLS